MVGKKRPDVGVAGRLTCVRSRTEQRLVATSDYVHCVTRVLESGILLRPTRQIRAWLYTVAKRLTYLRILKGDRFSGATRQHLFVMCVWAYGECVDAGQKRM